MRKLFSKKGSVPKQAIPGTMELTDNTDPLEFISRLQARRGSVDIQKSLETSAETYTYYEYEAKQLGFVRRPYNPELFLNLLELEPVFGATVARIASDVAGASWTLKLHEGARENEAEKKKIQEFLDKPNEDEDLRSVCEKLLTDWGAVGWFAIQVIKNLAGDVAEIHHLPVHALWAHKDKKRLGQIKRKDNKTEVVWFKKFGVEEDFSAETGEPGNWSLDERANELIIYKNYYPKSEHYGVPKGLPSLEAILTLKGIGDWNYTFFDSYGIPAYWIVLRGEWDPKAKQTLKEFVNKGSQSGNPHKSIVVSAREEGAAIEFNPLTTSVKEGSFIRLLQVLTNQVLLSYSMPPYRIGINIVGQLGGTNIKEANQIYKGSVVDPLQAVLENIITNKILAQGMDCRSYAFDLNEMDIRDEFAQADKSTALVQAGILSPNEVRRDMGLEPYPGGDAYYVSSQMIEAGEAEPIGE